MNPIDEFTKGLMDRIDARKSILENENGIEYKVEIKGWKQQHGYWSVGVDYIPIVDKEVENEQKKQKKDNEES